MHAILHGAIFTIGWLMLAAGSVWAFLGVVANAAADEGGDRYSIALPVASALFGLGLVVMMWPR